MESKLEIYDKLLCMACLCVGQELHKIKESNQRQFYTDTLKEINVSVPNLVPSMCWECADLLQKTVAFKEQLKDSYRTLLTYPEVDLLNLQTDANDTQPDPTEPDTLKDPDSNRALVFIKEDEVKEEPTDTVAGGLPVPQKEAKPEPVTITEGYDDGCLDHGLSGGSDNGLGYDTDTLVRDNGVESKKKKRAKETGKRRKPDNSRKIINIALTFEDMLAEREAEKTKYTYIKAPYKCESCIIGFNYKQSYKAHVHAKHMPSLGEYSCPVCDTIVASVESFTGHYKRHMKRYECSICHKRTADLKVMQQHYYTAHEIALKQYTCPVCGKISNSVDSHRYHRSTHRARVKCQLCDKTFSHRAGLVNHRLTVHENRNQFICSVCGKMFRWKASMKRHQDQHHRGDQLAPAEAYCSECDITFASIASYQRHMKNSLKHVSQQDLRFICDHCKRRFADKTKLRDHIEEKHLHRTYQCHICHKPSKNRVGLDQHIRNVHRGRPNTKMCHHCGKGFPTKVQLESHIRTHTGERPFICEICPTTFTQHSNLYKHNKQVHMNIKSTRSTVKKAAEDKTQTEAPAHETATPDHATPDPLAEQTPVAVMHFTPEGGFVMQ